MKMTFGHKAIDKIYKRRDRYEIPDWQRQKVWDRPKKQKLIDTILRGWKLPKFYIHKLAEDQFEVVDGQQRLTAIFEFFDNELPLSKSTAEEFKAEHYRDLPSKFSDAFDDFEIEYDEIEDASQPELKEFFQRLQEGLRLTTSERLNAVHSKLRDYCVKLSGHEFFKSKVSFPDTRYAHFDVVAKVATLEVEGINAGVRYDDIKAVFGSNSSFSSTSALGLKLKRTFDYLNRVFPEKSPLLRNRTVVQSFATLVARLIETKRADGFEQNVQEFFKHFMGELAKQVELGQLATDLDYVAFQRSVNANVKGGARLREEVLLRKLLTNSPDLADLFDPTIILESGLRNRILEVGQTITDLITMANAAYTSKNGEDLFKPTTKTLRALTRLGKTVKDFAGYQTLMDDLYFVFHESIGTRLDGKKPQSFIDINLLRTELQHDIDHGSKSKSRAKHKKIGATFSKYAGSTSPRVLAPEKFAPVQAKLLGNLEADLRSLIAQL